MLKSLIGNGYRPVTVGACLGDPPENWYRAGTGKVPKYTYTPLMPTGTFSCLPDAASSGTATSGSDTAADEQSSGSVSIGSAASSRYLALMILYDVVVFVSLYL